MPDTTPITIDDILAATDTARHAVPYVGGTVRALTVREILRLAQSHPGIVEVIDPSETRNAMELFEVVGRPGVQAAVMLSSDRWHWRVRMMRDVVLLHVFLSTLEVTMGVTDIDDLFTERRPEGTAAEPEQTEGIAKTSRLMHMVRDAGLIQARLGIDGLDLSPRRLAFLTRTLAGADRSDRQSQYFAVAAGMGSEKAVELLEGLY